MEIIPVIDLLNGVVVHAKKGARHHYQAIQSPLTPSSAPLHIVAALLAIYPFEQLYIADLNAIQKLNGLNPNNYAVIQSIQQEFPQLTLWLDAGISTPQALAFWQMPKVQCVIGSENLNSLEDYLALQPHPHILSLDFMTHGYQGPAALLHNPSLWPKDVIIMSLAHVGANQGVNLTAIQPNNVYGEHHFYMAGGVRNSEDLQQLKQANYRGALIATALHLQQISASDIAALNMATP